MKRFLRMTLSLLIVICMIVACAACGNKSNAPAPGPSGGSGGGSSSGGSSGGSGNSTPVAAKEKVIYTSYAQTVQTCDPLKTYTTATVQIINNHVFESLFEYKNGAQPELATSYEVDDSGTVFTIHLRDDVNFQNGDHMTADDVVFSFNRAYELGVWTAKMGGFKSIEKVDDYTVKISSEQKNVYFLQAICNINIVNKREVEEAGDNYGSIPTKSGTGPWFISEWAGDYQIVLEKNEGYWGGASDIDKIVFTCYEDSTTLYNAFMAGELNFTAIPEANYKSIVASGNYGYADPETDHIVCLIINNQGTKNPALKDVRVRQALNYAIDRDAVVTFSYEDCAAPAYTMFNPNLVEGSTYDGIVRYDYNPEKAKQLLAEAGYPDGLDLEITSASIYYFETAATAVQQMLKEIGVNCTINIMDAAAARAKYPKGDYDLGVMGTFVAETMDSVYPWWLVDGGNGYMCLTDTYPQSLLDKARLEFDYNKRVAICNEMCRYTSEQAFMIPLYHRSITYAWTSDIDASITGDYFNIYKDVKFK